MDEFQHIEQERTEEDSEVQLTDLPLLSNAGGKRSLWLARLLLGWPGSLGQQHWRQIGAMATLLLTVLAVLVILSPLHRGPAPSTVHPGIFSNPFLATYRSSPVLIYRGHFSEVRSVTWSPDGTRIASGGEDGTVQVWNAATGERTLTYQLYAGSLHSVTWSPDGTRIAFTSQDNSVQVWDAATGQHLMTYRGHAQSVLPAPDSPRSVLSIAWSPDGKHIASGSRDRTVQVWDAATGKGILIYRYHFVAVFAVAWSPDGKHIASGGRDRVVRVWDVSTGGDTLTYEDHAEIVWAVAWSPNGKFIASGSSDGTVQVWNATTGKRILTYLSSAFCVAWSPDGKRIASGGEDGSVKVWQVV